MKCGTCAKPAVLSFAVIARQAQNIVRRADQNGVENKTGCVRRDIEIYISASRAIAFDIYTKHVLPLPCCGCGGGLFGLRTDIEKKVILWTI